MLFYESERSDQHNYLYCQRDHNFNFPAHLHHSFEFLCVQSGTLACTLETEQYEVHPGEALLVLPDQIHSYRTIGESQSVLWVFSNDWVPEFISQLGQREFITPVFRMEAAPLMELLWPGGNRCKQLAGLYLICGTALEQCFLQPRPVPDVDAHLSSKIIDYVQKNYTHTLTLEQMARDLGYNYTYLSAYFNHSLHTGFQDFINQYRISHAAALLQGENLLLAGGKATGKNILADNLAWLFARPVFTASFHVNTDSSMLIGTDTFTGGEVRLRRGPISLAAQYGGFCVLDEINMAKNDAVAVLHSVLDYRRLIDVPGYECIPLHPATRFIATMNYGYAGTRELNEALVSRFTVIRMPTLDEAQLCELLRADVPEAAEENIRRCVGLFLDLNAKAVNGEISTNSVDLRGMIAALRLMTDGMAPNEAIAVSITNKCFDEYEYALVRDVVMTRFAQ